MLERHAARRGLAWIDDESNADTGIRRNYLRHEIAPRLAAAFPGYPATLARSSAHCAEAALLLDELAALDADGVLDAGEQADRDVARPATLDRAALAALAGRSPARARNLLRWYLRQQGLVPPSTARLAAMLEQLAHAAPDARVRLAHDGVEIGIHRGRIAVHAPSVAPFALAWSGERALVLPHGVLEFAPALGAGLAAGALAAAPVTVRRREGGERLCLVPGRSAAAAQAPAPRCRRRAVAARGAAARLVRRRAGGGAGHRRRCRVPRGCRRGRARPALASGTRAPGAGDFRQPSQRLTRVKCGAGLCP